MTRDRLEEAPPVEGSGDFLADMVYTDPAATRRHFALCANLRVAIAERYRGSVRAAAAVSGIAETDLSKAVRGLGDFDEAWLVAALEATRKAR
jgi:hypothetical protein